MANASAYKTRRSTGLAAAISLLLVIGIWLNSQSAKSRDSTLQTAVIPSTGDSNWRPWLKASKVRVSAVAFYGRRRYVRILDKYLKENLISAGGLLEEVLPFFVLTCYSWLDDSKVCIVNIQTQL